MLYKRIKDLMVIEEEFEWKAFHMSSNVLAVCYTAALKARKGPANNVTRHWVWNCLLNNKNILVRNLKNFIHTNQMNRILARTTVF